MVCGTPLTEPPGAAGLYFATPRLSLYSPSSFSLLGVCVSLSLSLCVSPFLLTDLSLYLSVSPLLHLSASLYRHCCIRRRWKFGGATKTSATRSRDRVQLEVSSRIVDDGVCGSQACWAAGQWRLGAQSHVAEPTVCDSQSVVP